MLAFVKDDYKKAVDLFESEAGRSSVPMAVKKASNNNYGGHK